GRIQAGAQEEVAAVAEAEVVHYPQVTFQDPQRLSRLRQVPEVDVVVIATGREYLAVAPPRQRAHVAGVLEGRQLLPVAQVVELNEAAADDGQPASVRLELNVSHRGGPRRQVLPPGTRRQLMDPDRVIALGKCYQPAIRTERR